MMWFLLAATVACVAAIIACFWYDRFHPFFGFYSDDYRARHCHYNGRRWVRR